jgi:hypothetical protein
LIAISRGLDLSAERAERLARETAFMRLHWDSALDADPYYNPNFCYGRNDFGLGFPPRGKIPEEEVFWANDRYDPGTSASTAFEARNGRLIVPLDAFPSWVL